MERFGGAPEHPEINLRTIEPLHWIVVGFRIRDRPHYSEPGHADELPQPMRSWLYEHDIRHVLVRSIFDMEKWLLNGRPKPIPVVRFFVGFRSEFDAFAFKMRWG